MNTPAPTPELRTFPIIFAAPSGAGKTSIARELKLRRPDVEFSVSCTTRPARPGERDGLDYHFRTEEEFQALIAAGDLLEWAFVHDHLYGTPRLNLEQARARRHFLLLDIDVQGSRQIKRTVPEAVSVFVLPPSGEELGRRLVGRGSEDAAIQRRRLRTARDELAAATEFDYVFVNENLADSVDAVERIMAAEAMRVPRLRHLPEFIARLLREIDVLLDQ